VLASAEVNWVTKKKNDSGRGKQDKKEGFPESAIPYFFDQMEKQMEIWSEFVESEEGQEMTSAGMDFAQISTKHMAEMFGKIGGLLPENLSPEEVFQKSKEIYLTCANSYSEMFKEAMATSSIPKQNARMIDAFLTWKIETDKINQETLKNLGIPTKDDMDEIAEKLYWLDKKMDNVTKDLRQANGRSRKSKKK
jgi:hypothetical protein